MPHLRQAHVMSSQHIEDRRRVEAVTSAHKLMEAINGTVLKPRERDVLLLKCFEGLSHLEIGDKLHISEKTSQRVYAKALRKLQDAL